MTKIKVLLASGAFSAAILAAGTASAMPMSSLASAASDVATTQQVRWVCGPFRCFWRPNYSGYYHHYAFAPRFYRHHWWGGPRFYGPRFGFYGRSWWGGGY